MLIVLAATLKMLWAKESSRTDALYVDIFGLNQGEAVLREQIHEYQIEQKKSTLNKDDELSHEFRTMGNEYFGDRKWIDAIDMYNASLRHAENGSKNISLAYANRSNCFLKLKRYNECLKDIELAKKTGYPLDLMSKLEQRKEECLNANGLESAQLELKLDYEPNERIPCMANVLKIERDSEGDLAVFATENIAVGETIVVEKAFMTCVFLRYGITLGVLFYNTVYV